MLSLNAKSHRSPREAANGGPYRLKPVRAVGGYHSRAPRKWLAGRAHGTGTQKRELPGSIMKSAGRHLPGPRTGRPRAPTSTSLRR